jgi:hypothetical protein
MPQKKTTKNNDFIGLFFDYINRDLNKIDFRNIVEIGIEYLQLLYFSKEGSKLSDYKEKYNLFTNIPLESSDESLEKIKKYLLEIQSFMRKLLVNLINNRNTFSVSQSGKRVVSVVDGKFIETFETKKIPMADFDKSAEKQRIKALLLDHIINERLEPDKFVLCGRKVCKNYFYKSPGGRPQEYCSKSCGSAARMQDQRDKKKQKN